MIYTIYLKEPADRFDRFMSTRMLGKPLNPADYVKVATVEASGLVELFRNTQNDFFERGWFAAAVERFTDDDGRRSVSVGDLVVEPNGTVRECDAAGWIDHGKIDLEPDEILELAELTAALF